MLGYILSGVGFTLALICFILYYREYRRVTNELTRRREAELEKRTAALLADIKKNEEKYAELEKQKKELEKQRLYEQDRAREARDATERLLKAEHERAAAELGRVKEVEELKLQQQLKEKEAQLEAQFNFKKIQFVEDFNVLEEAIREQLADAQSELNEYQAKRAAINDAILRERELEEKEDFYRISIKENDIKDIEVLRSIEPRLTNREVLNKLIYEVFIKRPLMEMEKRVLQGRKIGGIYKITYIKTGESYIGRSVDIGNRWKEHCLSSLNIGTIAHSTFHNVLADKGLQNFTWEVLEEVDKDKQSSREKYWIDFYQTDKQYNQKAGG